MLSKPVVVLLLAGLALVLGLPAAPVGANAPGDGPPALLGVLAQVAPQHKVDAALLEAAREDPGQDVWVVVQSTRRLDLARFGPYRHQFTWPAGEHVAILPVAAGDVPAIAALPGVYAVDSGELVPPGESVDGDPEVVRPARPDPDALRSAARLAPPWSATPPRAGALPGSGAPAPIGPTPGSEAVINGWFDVRKGHSAQEAWSLGYRGEGVRVAVLDYAIDYAHPDLQGTWAVLPSDHPYGGWPEVFDPNVGYIAVQDAPRAIEQRWSRTARSGMIELYQTSAVTATTGVSGTLHTACFQPGIYTSAGNPFSLAAADCTYRVPGTSRSGQVRFGHHPDAVLRANGAKPDRQIAGEWAGVLLVDEVVAGTYDTVYVDLDGDRDFTDEKPMTKGDPLGWRDIDGDGLADVAGGLLYWIADGQLPFPGSWVWGLEAAVAPAASVVGILWASSDHGTLCASNVASQGVLKVPGGYTLRFRDLPAGGEPPSTNAGLAPDARLVSVGSVYTYGNPIWSASWRYGVFGHDRDRHDDDIQVTSNSYGFSGNDNDAWDADSRLIDYYVRKFSPSTSFVFATGNGGSGYGTVVPPKPAVALGIAASTQMGSTGTDTITDTAQITFGDIIAWSNRGPASEGRNGVTIAADGAYGSGAEPINFIGSGALANATWGGTSRSTPVASGALALVYQAFRDVQGRWPTWEEAKSILMSGARHAGYDTFTQGAGVLDAGDAVRIASGRRGIYATPPEWTAGGYRGTTYPAFASIMLPGQTATTTLTLRNPTGEDVEVHLSAQTPRRIGSVDDAVATDLARESHPSAVPDYIKAVPRSAVPEGTELMVVRARYPLAQFDRDGNYAADNRFTVGVFQHTDIDGDGRLWADRDGNGVVGTRYATNALVRLAGTGGTREADAVEATFTRALKDAPVTGEVAFFGTGCSGAPAVQDVAGKIALVERSTCAYQQPVTNTQAAGAIGVVVYTDDRSRAAMGGTAGGINIPAVMIDNLSGAWLRDQVLGGAAVTAELSARAVPRQGLDGSAPVDWSGTELDQYEYMRFNADTASHNNFAVSVHHPLERWSDGIYVGLWHPARTRFITETLVSLRYDFYRYEPWDAVRLSREAVTVPAGGSVTVEAALTIGADAPPGALQGAIFADYARVSRPTIYLPVALDKGTPGAGATLAEAVGAGVGGRGVDQVTGPPGLEADVEADLGPGGYELADLRTVIPVNASVARAYDWTGNLTFGGQGADDPDAPYSNGSTWGTFRWDWRAESGDWRFYFLDAASAPPNTLWLYRTRWQDAQPTQADIDTRVYGPTTDRFSDPDHRDNQPEDMSDPLWYGPYTLGLLTRSPYNASGSVWRFNTTSGGADDWLSAPARGGLHEVMLHNVLFSGSQFAMPFQTDVGSVQLSALSLDLVGDACTTLTITPTLDLGGLATLGFGPSVPEVLADQSVRQDPAAFAETAYRHDLVLAGEASRFVVSIDGEDDDNLDLYLLRDANGDGQFKPTDPNNEVVARATTTGADERVTLSFTAAGKYQVWVHGRTVNGAASTFELTIDVVTGPNIRVKGAPSGLPGGVPTALEVCADPSVVGGADGPGSGLLTLGPDGARRLLQIPVTWRRNP
jgi:hypothetical protein